MSTPYKGANSWCTQFPIGCGSTLPYLGAMPPAGTLLRQREPVMIPVASPCACPTTSTCGPPPPASCCGSGVPGGSAGGGGGSGSYIP